MGPRLAAVLREDDQEQGQAHRNGQEGRHRESRRKTRGGAPGPDLLELREAGRKVRRRGGRTVEPPDVRPGCGPMSVAHSAQPARCFSSLPACPGVSPLSRQGTNLLCRKRAPDAHGGSLGRPQPRPKLRQGPVEPRSDCPWRAAEDRLISP